MAKAILQRLFQTPPTVRSRHEAFTLPGILHEAVRILLIESGELTDLLFAMPFVEEVKRRHPRSHFGLLCTEASGRLALSSGLFQDLVVVDPDQFQANSSTRRRVESILARQEWEVAILLSREPDVARETLAYASGAVLRLGPGHRQAFPHLNCELRSPPENGTYPYQRTATWGRLLGVALENVPLHWPLAQDAARQAAQLVHFNKPRKDQLLIGVDPGVGKAGTVLAAENLAFLLNHLASHLRCKTIILTAEEEGERARHLQSLLRSDQLDLPQPTLKETLCLLSQCDLFLAGNTDLFHFAAAMGVATLGIFTPSDPERWVPTAARKVEILRSKEGAPLSLSDLMERVDRLLA